MHTSLRSLFIALLLGTLAWSAPAWHAFSPAGEKFTCQVPPGKVQEVKNPAAHQWIILEPGKYAVQVASIGQGGSAAQVNFYVANFLKSAKVTETGRKPVKVNGLSGLEVNGSMTPSAKEKVSVRMRVFATKDHIYHLAAFLPSAASSKSIEPFFGSFKLK